MEIAYRIGSRGFVVQGLQNALGLPPDGRFGSRTAAAVAAKQLQLGSPATGDANKPTFAALAVTWPDEFERCMNLTSALEGTGFGDCNAADIDGAGLTLGVAGFTSASGEVQELLNRLFAARPEAVEALPRQTSSQVRDAIARRAGAAEWRRLFYGTGNSVKAKWVSAFRTWGQLAEMQAAQLQMARARFWQPAIAAANQLQIESLAGKALLFDVGVQNGGWAQRHQRQYELRLAQEKPADETAKLRLIAQVVAACAASRWQADVLARKLMFADGGGTVHGEQFELLDYAIR